ncbi:MAG: IMP dehydrogenase [Fibrobacteria bacterium]|nr:IMP dehydrogenase [Fibrobacteria bacterium]
MAQIIKDISRTFSEYLILPGLSKKKNTVENVNLGTPICKFKKGKKSRLTMNIPIMSACMQSVSGPDLAIELARQGGMSCIFCSQPIESQVEMVKKVKRHKAGFVTSTINLKPSDPLLKAIRFIKETGHSTMPVTDDGSDSGKFLGILTDKDFWEYEDNLNNPVKNYMTPVERVIWGKDGISLKQANALLHKHKKQCLPILNKKGNLTHLVFTKDFVDHQNHPDELLDNEKRFVVAAGINTHDYRERVPALVEAGANVLCFDSSDGYTEFQKEAALWVRKKYGKKVVMGGGNVVSGKAFNYLVKEADLDFVKIGIGGGSICITREQKGIGRGQASAVMDVVEARNQYFKKTGTYIPVCSDGGLINDTQLILALAMGADFVMMGRYFAMTFESPTKKISIKDKLYKPYWGEGSNRAKNWKRYSEGGSKNKLEFEEGVDAYVPIVGSVKEVLPLTLSKLKSTMCNTGTTTLQSFSKNALITLVSEQSFIEGGTSSVVTFDQTRLDQDYLG